MTKKIILLLLCSWVQIGLSQPKNYKNTENATLKDAFPKDHEKVTPGCLNKEQLHNLKSFLKNKWKVDLDSVKTLHFYYSKDKRDCKVVNDRMIKGTKYFNPISRHSRTVTAIYKPIIYIKSEAVEAKDLWKNDNSDYLFNMFLKDIDKKIYPAAITVNSKGIYLIDFEAFNTIVFNAFSNEVDKFSCE
ncbi:hypothetical protein FLJC2902T_15650 [Flavobacterium limnosediminis JC2902]|uniref:Uncharacterized protein n=1 Tax=Flavobacterium limnosediminis JC2902 TaxID=1341181 RepID=V6SP61_9FLAO|nr:hypothetical protein [Flavobacterium limnosediminis]ESU28219.1 hypothetical protein FLJC2902T_15650 [Flavobacterium limnosediminis JC2902]